MCWKSSPPPPEPTPPMPTIDSVTAAAEAGLRCPHSAVQCNSTTVTCLHGITCCLKDNEDEVTCSCLSGWEPPDCVYEEIPNYGMASRYAEADGGRIAVIVVVVVILLAIIIAAAFVIRKIYKKRQLGNNHGVNGSSTERQSFEIGSPAAPSAKRDSNEYNDAKS